MTTIHASYPHIHRHDDERALPTARSKEAVDMTGGGQLGENAGAFTPTCPPPLDNSLSRGCDILNELRHVTFLKSLDR